MLREEFADEPEVAEGIDHGALEHAADGLGTESSVLVLPDRAVFGRAGSDGLTLNQGGIVDEELDPDGGETGGTWGASAVGRSFLGEEERGSVDRDAGDGVVFVNRTEKLRAESGLIKSDGGFSVVNGEHGGDLCWHGGDLSDSIKRRREETIGQALRLGTRKMGDTRGQGSRARGWVRGCLTLGQST